jgi:hypothetical protein
MKKSILGFKIFECDILHNQELCHIYQLNNFDLIQSVIIFKNIQDLIIMKYCEVNFIVIYVINFTFAGSLVIKRILKYQHKGDLASENKVLDYLNKRDIGC